jgi:hypothetical protein
MSREARYASRVMAAKFGLFAGLEEMHTINSGQSVVWVVMGHSMLILKFSTPADF